MEEEVGEEEVFVLFFKDMRNLGCVQLLSLWRGRCWEVEIVGRAGFCGNQDRAGNAWHGWGTLSLKVGGYLLFSRKKDLMWVGGQGDLLAGSQENFLLVASVFF